MFYSLLLEHYKNHTNWNFLFGMRNIILWANGSGKTHVLEAIHDLCNGRFQSIHETQCIEGWLETSVGVCKYRMFTDTNGTSYFYQDKKVPRKKYIESLSFRSVSFSPIDMNLLYLSPSHRRDFLDDILDRAYDQFSSVRSKYNRLLKQRNALLKKISQQEAWSDDLDYWDHEIAKTADIYIQYRLHLIEFLQKWREDLNQFFHWKHDISLCYISKIPTQDVAQSVQQYLLENRQRDILLGHTYVWPHLDDFWFFISYWWDKILSSEHLSRWENKILLLFLKYFEVVFLERITKKWIIVLLDDLFSELDAEYSNRVLQMFSKYQIFITAQFFLEHIRESWDFSCINLNSQ